MTAMLLALLGYAPLASAYLDPGTGSMIMSAIVGLFATAALAVKTYWYRIKRLFTGRRPPEPARPDEEADPEEPSQTGSS